MWWDPVCGAGCEWSGVHIYECARCAWAQHSRLSQHRWWNGSRTYNYWRVYSRVLLLSSMYIFADQAIFPSVYDVVLGQLLWAKGWLPEDVSVRSLCWCQSGSTINISIMILPCILLVTDSKVVIHASIPVEHFIRKMIICTYTRWFCDIGPHGSSSVLFHWCGCMSVLVFHVNDEHSLACQSRSDWSWTNFGANLESWLHAQ